LIRNCGRWSQKNFEGVLENMERDETVIGEGRRRSLLEKGSLGVS